MLPLEFNNPLYLVSIKVNRVVEFQNQHLGAPGCQIFLAQDNYLIFLVLQGLEGRSTNPVSVLFDALEHPDADLGVQQPSLLEWKLRKDLSVNHVVLGPGCPGGAWNVLTYV